MSYDTTLRANPSNYGAIGKQTDSFNNESSNLQIEIGKIDEASRPIFIRINPQGRTAYLSLKCKVSFLLGGIGFAAGLAGVVMGVIYRSESLKMQGMGTLATGALFLGVGIGLSEALGN